ncbi:MAG: toll/interleukin-1 receptor domain-containing protein [Anaerolineales bacterium]|jgi:hypothetical protein
MPREQPQTLFLSYNSGDKDFVRKLAAALSVAGARVWFDEWTIRPGDSIPGEIDKGLSQFDSFALVWSEFASKSRWVKTEMEAAVARWVQNPTQRLIPVRLDNTPLPAILSHIRYVDGIDGNWVRVASELLGIQSEAAFRIAVQQFIDEAGLEFHEFQGVGVLVACPSCGAGPEHLKAWSATDYERDDLYVGARCEVCGWSSGSEM